MQAYKNYVASILNRVNTLTGVKYSADPAIFSFELANEPACSAGYEDKMGVARGSTVRAWVAEMAAYIRSLDANHMVGRLTSPWNMVMLCMRAFLADMLTLHSFLLSMYWIGIQYMTQLSACMHADQHR
jgi:endo-1,4-beta-mannosidase